ncbi:type VI secretion system Vgr family protein, partial [Celeribacter ethanolicus]|uniref:type VI secretion system Vgr family protein n=1 Tax=Celeribacter ethanolicus TaxID=1758178 RepID=UPI000ABE9DCA
GYAYTGRYVLLPADAPLVPELKTARADVKGPQTAVVVGDGEIDCDEYGRILVQFHWDLDAAYSMRCRVSQSWAGNGWGGMVIPRIGMEVVVEFLDGDPDKPLVTGCVYNGKNAVPYDLPEHKTRSTFQTDTHEGEGFNELRFEDKKGEEEVRTIAQRDMNTLVKNNEAKIVLNDSSTAIYDNELREVFGNSILSVGGSVTTYVGATGAMALAQQDMGARRNTLSKMAYALDRQNLKENGSPGDYTIITDGSHETTIGQSHINQVGDNQYNSVGKNHSLNVDGNSAMRVGGDSSVHVQKSKTEIVGDKYTIVCGASRIEMHSNGKVVIKGVDIEISGSSSITNKAPRIDLN